MYSITENKKSFLKMYQNFYYEKKNMWFVLAERLSSVYANDEIQKIYIIQNVSVNQHKHRKKKEMKGLNRQPLFN